MVHFGDHLASAMSAASGAGASYVGDVLGVVVIGEEVHEDIGDQTAPTVLPLHAAFSRDFNAYGSCPQPIGRFDHIEATTGASRGHGFQVVNAPGFPLP